MTDNEIIKALECCTSSCREIKCNSCLAFVDCRCTLKPKMLLDLINRQKAEIERLKKIQQVQADRIVEERGRRYELANTLSKEIKTAKSEAIKIFAEKLKESAFDVDVSFGYGKECYDKAVAVIEIDNLVKERVGEDNEMQNAEVD